MVFTKIFIIEGSGKLMFVFFDIYHQILDPGSQKFQNFIQHPCEKEIDRDNLNFVVSLRDTKLYFYIRSR